MLTCLLSFLIGSYLTGFFFVFMLGSGDPEGRFKYRYVFLWPIYISKLFRGEYP